MTRIVYNKSEFVNMAKKNLDLWVTIHKRRLIGSAVFTANNSIVSKIVSWASNLSKKEQGFIPSHVGSIIEVENNLFVFNMQPPRASMTPLVNYLLFTDNNYELVMRDFELNEKMFSANIFYHLDEFYPYLSALRSVFTKRNTKWVNHCSELHLRELQKQGLYKNVNPECTPLELYEVLKGINK